MKEKLAKISESEAVAQANAHADELLAKLTAVNHGNNPTRQVVCPHCDGDLTEWDTKRKFVQIFINLLMKRYVIVPDEENK